MRSLLAGRVGALALLAFLSGCGNGGPTPALAGTTCPIVRVLLGAVRARATLEVREQAWEAWLGPGERVAERGVGLSGALAASASGISLRGRETGARELRIRPASWFALDGIPYAGTLVVRREGAGLQFVNELDLESYVAGVVANELAPGAPPAAFRAQAVAARTYAWMKVTDPDLAGAPFHLFDDQRSQVYRGLSIPKEMAGEVTAEDLRARARETRGVVLTWRGRPFRAWYASTCGGHTTDPFTGLLDPGGTIEPLRGVPCSHCATSRYFTWEKPVGDLDLVASCQRDTRPISLPIHSIEVLERGRGGWARTVRVEHGPRREAKIVPGSAFRTLAGLRSHRIAAITRVPGGWQVTGGGWGHGVGMCQWGAIEMARRGLTEAEILGHYYPGASFTRLY